MTLRYGGASLSGAFVDETASPCVGATVRLLKWSLDTDVGGSYLAVFSRDPDDRGATVSDRSCRLATSSAFPTTTSTSDTIAFDVLSQDVASSSACSPALSSLRLAGRSAIRTRFTRAPAAPRKRRRSPYAPEKIASTSTHGSNDDGRRECPVPSRTRQDNRSTERKRRSRPSASKTYRGAGFEAGVAVFRPGSTFSFAAIRPARTCCERPRTAPRCSVAFDRVGDATCRRRRRSSAGSARCRALVFEVRKSDPSDETAAIRLVAMRPDDVAPARIQPWSVQRRRTCRDVAASRVAMSSRSLNFRRLDAQSAMYNGARHLGCAYGSGNRPTLGSCLHCRRQHVAHFRVGAIRDQRRR